MTAEDGLTLLAGVLDSEYLSQTQTMVFRKAWEGQSYLEIAIATGYDHGYIKETGAQLWKLLSRILGKKVTKNNFRNVITGLSSQKSSSLGTSYCVKPSRLRQSWGEASDVDSFYGRLEEQALLEKWLVQDCCRFISLLGIGGVGKTALSIKVAKQVQGEFDYIVWRSLRQAPLLAELLPDVILFLSKQKDAKILHTAPQQIEQLLEYLRKNRCLLVLDNLESILQTGERAGGYRTGYEDYGYFLERISDIAHQSCLIVTSREKPKGLSIREGNGLWVRSLQLTGLDYNASQALLASISTDADSEQQLQLTERYSGNPLALKIVAATIRSIFNSSAADFLDYGTVVFGDLWDLLDQQFERLSTIEQTVMRWLAINREWISLKELRADIIPVVSHRALLEAAESLKARSLIETSRAGITQQPVVMEYMTERLVAQFCEEITQQNFDICSRYALLKANAREFVRESQVRHISRSLLEKLLMVAEQELVEERLKQMLFSFKSRPASEIGYAGGNILNLLCQLEADLRGQDLSGLTLWQVYLSGQNLQEVNLAHADLSKSVFSESLGSAISVSLSPNETVLAAGDTNGEIHLWNVSNGQKKRSIEAHDGWIWSVPFSPDGSQIASSSEDHTVKIWDVKTGQLNQICSGHSKRVSTVVWHPNGQQLVSGSEDRTIKIWNVETGKCVRTLAGHGEAIEPVAISPNGRIAVGGSPVTKAIELWDVETGECIGELVGHTQGVRALTFTPDSRRVVSGGMDTTVRVWDIETGKCIHILGKHCDALWSVGISADGTLIVSGGEDKTVRIWDAHTGYCLRTLYGFSARVWSIALSERSPILASCDDQSIKLWDTDSGKCLKTIRGYPQVNWTVVFTPDASSLISGGQERIVRAWDLQTGSCSQPIQKYPSYVHTIHHHPVEPVIASGADNTVYLWDLETQQRLHALEGHTGKIWQVEFCTDGRLLASASFDQSTRLWDWKLGTCLHAFQGHGTWVFGIGFSPDGKMLATSGMDKTVKLWNCETGECLKSLPTGEDWMTDVAFSADGQTVVGGGSQGELVVLHIKGNAPVRALSGHTGFVSAVSFSADGKTVASSSHDQTIKIWDATTFECLKTLEGHKNMVSSVSYSADSATIATASHDETVRVWDVSTGKCLNVLQAPRPYENMNIKGVTGLTEAQKASLSILGAI